MYRSLETGTKHEAAYLDAFLPAYPAVPLADQIGGRAYFEMIDALRI
ncbi:MAG: hypothetical protein ACR2NN_29835 [Bryobacteraceae bacterium]